MTAREPDVEIAASAKARELRFLCKPAVRVTAWAGSAATAEAAGERGNLPDTVEPGVVYRDVSVRWRAAARLQEE